VTPNTKISSSASRKFGMQMPKSAKVVPARSAAVFRRTADRMPRGKATSTETVMLPEVEARAQAMLQA
jgi:hypothetical protein